METATTVEVLMTQAEIRQFSDERLLAETERVAAKERRSTAELLALLMEVERRGVHVAMGYSSLFVYCTRALRLSEQAAYSRITAARAARRFPILRECLAEGALTLSSVGLLAPHLTEVNHDALLAAARHRSTRDVERLVACLHPQPDIASSLRRMPRPSRPADVGGPARLSAPGQIAAAEGAAAEVVEPVAADRSGAGIARADWSNAGAAAADLDASDPAGARTGAAEIGVLTAPSPQPAPQPAFPPVLPPVLPTALPPVPSRIPRPVLAPLAPGRYWLKVTIGQETHDKLQRARDLLRHVIPDGDPAAILDRALTLLVEQAARTKHAERLPDRTRTQDQPLSAVKVRPSALARPARATPTERSRYIPAEVKRAVWTRDAGRCAFVGAAGRCRETAFLEFHHVVPFAARGPTSAVNLQLRCRAHNAYEANVFFGADRVHGPPMREG
jgi:hypothetical protein